MKNLLERGIAIGLLAFSIGVVHADIVARNGGHLPALGAPAADTPTSVRYLTEPRKTSSVVLVKYKKAVKKIDLKGGAVIGGTNLTAQSDSMQTSSYVGAGRRIRNIEVVSAR